MRTIGRTLTATIATLWRSDAALTSFGFLMLVVLAAAAVGLWVDPRTITGAPAWLKPAKFAISTAIYSFTLAWIFSYLRGWPRMRRVVGRATVFVFALEVGLIALQAWRGTTSHFNVSTPLDGVLFGVMGLAIVAQTVLSIAVAVALWQQPFTDRALGWALRLGVAITIAGASTGGLMTRPTAAQLEATRAGARMTVVGAHTVGAPDGGRGLPVTGWSVEHGDVRVPHFVGLHAMQLLPLFALLIGRSRWHDAAQARLVVVAAGAYASLFAILLWQALRGQSILDADEAAWPVLAVWAIMSVAAAVAAGLRRDSPQVRAFV